MANIKLKNMKLGFSTLGCPEWDIDLIIERALEFGFDGVEFRGYLGNLDLRNNLIFTTKVESTIEKFKSAEIDITCFSTSVRLYSESKSKQEENLSEIEYYSRLCKMFGTPYLRVFCGMIENKNMQNVSVQIIDNLKEMVLIAKKNNVKIIIETHDNCTDSKYLQMIINGTKSESVGVLWDIHHPFVTSGESPSLTWKNLGRWINYTHWKDSIFTGDVIEYCSLGEGKLPLEKFYNILSENNYTGYYVFEWEKKWHPELESPETAFPKYVKFMRDMYRTSSSI